MKKYNVLSLFDGKSSGMTACELAGIPVGNYYAAEVDKFATKVSQAMYPNIIRLGDVTKWREWNIEWDSIDLVIGGSPCQGFSYAGKQLAFDDPRSFLFFVFKDILNHVRTFNKKVKFMLENVKMKAEFMDIITTEIETDSIMINSSLVSSQNRKRNYWSNIPIDQPKDLGIYLKDIIDESVQFEEQSNSWHKWWKTNKEFQLKKKYSAIVNDGSTDKAICMTARQYASWNGNFLIIQTPRGNNTGGIRDINGKTPCLSSCSWQHNNHLIKNERYRKLTPRECFRLQTVPEHLIDKILLCGVSSSQLYKIAGNGWTDEVIGHIFRGLHDV